MTDPETKKKKSTRRGGGRKRSLTSEHNSALHPNSHLDTTQENKGKLGDAWADAVGLLVVYLIMDVLLLIGFARFRLLFIAVLLIAAYLLQKYHKAKLLWAWLLTLFGLFMIGICYLFYRNEVVYSASLSNIIPTHQIEEIFSISSLLWTLGLFAIVFSAYIYYVKKKDRVRVPLEWRVALLNMLLFLGFMHLIF